MQISKTIVINCAGMGERLGFGHTKALLEVGGKPLIIHHLEQVKDFEDVRIVVGFDAQELISTVLKYRRNVVFVFNHNYLTTGTLASLSLAVKHAKDQIASIDGDLLVNPKDLRRFLYSPEDQIGFCEPYTDHPVYVNILRRGNKQYVTSFSRKSGRFEWTGLVQIKREAINPGNLHVYHTLEDKLPLLATKIDCREIDTPDDLVSAMKWARKIFK